LREGKALGNENGKDDEDFDINKGNICAGAFKILSKSKLLYDRRSVGQSVCLGVEPSLGLVTRYYFLSEGCCLKVRVLFLWGALSDERTGLQIAVQSLRGSSLTEPVASLSHLRLPQPGGPGSRIYIPGHWVKNTEFLIINIHITIMLFRETIAVCY
jgi:hypothetical protein